MKLVFLITNKGKSENIVKACVKHNLIEAVTLLGKGTASTQILDALSLAESDKDVVVALTDDKHAPIIFNFLEEEFDFINKGFGVGFALSLNSISAKTFSMINELFKAGDQFSDLVLKGDNKNGN